MAVMTMTTTIKKPETLSVRDLLADPELTPEDLKLLALRVELHHPGCQIDC